MLSKHRFNTLNFWWKCCIVLLIIIWGTLAVYIVTRELPKPPPASIVTVQEECLHYASKCDLRLHFLDELQQYRMSLYHEYRVTPKNPVRFLFFTSTYYYERYMDRWYLRYDAAARNPFVEAVLWGPGFYNYSYNYTLRENIARVYGSATYFHVINIFIWQRKYVEELRQISNETAVMEIHDEAWCIPGENCADKVGFISYVNASLVGFAYPSEMLIAEWQEIAARRHMFHIPKTVSAEEFYIPPNVSAKAPDSLEEAVETYDRARDIDVLFLGAMHQRLYPVRWIITCMYKSGYFDDLPYKFYHKLHPGYKKRTTDEFNLTMANQQIDEYASLIQRSKIVITDSSRYNYAVGKYAEIPTAGALILGDIPDEREDDFNQFVARVHNKMKPQEIVDVIKYWLENPVERYLRARRGQIITLQKYTNDHSVDLMVLAYLRFKQNRFGAHFSYPFADSCKAISPVSFSRHCEEQNDRFGIDMSLEAGWFLPPNNCTLTLHEESIIHQTNFSKEVSPKLLSYKKNVETGQ